MIIKLKTKAGMSLVEVVIAIALLAVLVVSAITALNLTHTSISNTSLAEKNSTVTQGIVDDLMAAISSCSGTSTDDQIAAACSRAVSEATKVTNFDGAQGGKQYILEKQPQIVSDGSKGANSYKVTARVYYDGGATTYSGTASPLGGLQDD